MDLKNKLKNIPHVYYFNLDNRTDRREYMESQFDYWKINFTRISGTKFLASRKNEWKHLMYKPSEYKLLVPIAANAISHLDFLQTWLKETDDPYLILMEDDYDLGLIEYWHFDWDYLMNNIPYDWDCIQLGFENPFGIPFYLHPMLPAHDFGPCMITRDYAEKLVRLHYIDGKYHLVPRVANHAWNKQRGVSGPGSVDYFMCHNGRTYSIPLITINPDFNSFEDNSPIQKQHRMNGDVLSRNCYYRWWKTERDNYTLKEFFTYGKSNDSEMVRRSVEYGNYEFKK